MRKSVLLSFFLCAVALVVHPRAASAQFMFQESEPLIDASQEEWVISGVPMLMDGLIFFQTGLTIYFDPEVMVRTGVYRGIPVYQDRTLEPFSIVYVPVGGRIVRKYERRRQGELAETTGSHTPSWPVQGTPTRAEEQRFIDRAVAAAASFDPGVTRAEYQIEPFTQPAFSAALVPAASSPRPAKLPNGVYVEFAGARWYGSGKPTAYSPDTFTPVGVYAGSVVYRMKNDSANRIWIPVVDNGPLAQYSKR